MKQDKEPIAIIGVGCRFPGAANPESFWQLLHDGVDAITEVPPCRWDVNALYDPDSAKPDEMNIRWGGFLEHVDQFDPQFFSIAPREAVSIDPKQRLLLEVAWEALEDAGQIPEHLAGTQTGVFIGISSYDYYELLVRNSIIDAYGPTGNNNCIAAHRISYVFDFIGPSMAIDTACFSSLVAVHLACQSLWSGECTMALVGGVHLMLSPWVTMSFAKGGFLAPDGRCKTFDARANGYVRGEGAGVVVLKPLSQAQADGDSIYAVVRGSAINQDGRSNGLTAPNPRAQESVLREAYRQAGVAPSQVQYIEAHGTGTILGDPIEMKALGKVLAQDRLPKNYCATGSVKTNIGHLEAAAGIAGLIKVALSLKHQKIPPSLHFREPNPYIPFNKLPLQVQQVLGSWPQRVGLALAGVSSFGFGGTNAHVVLEEAPIQTPVTREIERPLHFLTLRSKSENALRELARHYKEFLVNHPTVSIADVCFTANTGRSHFDHRLAVITESSMQLQGALGAFASGRETDGLLSGQVTSRKRPKIAFLFTGQGSQYVGMGRQLYETQPTFRQTLDRCDEILRPYLEKPLLEVLYPATVESSPLDETAYTQPTLFALEYALAELWKSWGIEPTVVMGHSVGEYVAACVAGVFSLEDALKLIAERACLMQALPQQGEMVAVFAHEARVRATIQPYLQEVAIAAINGPEGIVISGNRQAVRAVIATLEAEEVNTKNLRVSHAFHSPLMEPMLDAFEQTASQIPFQAPRIPLLSNVTGQILPPGHIPDANYWRRHTREAVRFMAGMNTLFEQGYELFVEVGPKPILSSLGKRCQQEATAAWLPSLVQGKDDWQVLLDSLSALYVQGADVNLIGFDKDYSRSRLSLPTYPFEQKRYWIKEGDFPMDGKKSGEKVSEAQVDVPSQTSRRDMFLSTLHSIVADLLQLTPSEVSVDAPFTELGADSIVLIEALRGIENTFGLKVTIRQLFEELATINALATYIDQSLPPAFALENSSPAKFEPVVFSGQTTQSAERNAPKETSQHQTPDIKDEEVTTEVGLEHIMAQQLEVVSKVISQQLKVLSNSRLSPERSLPLKTQPFDLPNHSISSVDAPFQNVLANADQKKTAAEPFVPFRPIKPGAKKNLAPRQQQHLEALIVRYTKHTQESKRQKQTYHPVLADSRAVAGFRLSIKEMLYPIIGERAQGSRLVDVDGNEYVDITMGFGVLLFGHAAPFITEAVEEQIKLGIKFGSQSNLAGEVADLICELTGMERVTFCNSGTEAVMTALRLARTVTGRTKIALFAGSYHGHFDGVLASVSNSQISAVPITPGVSQHTVEDVLVLDYENPNSIDILQAHAHELAAVLVEPVQSRRPDLQPKEFLQQLRQWTQAAGTALIFDEVLTGFRIHPGGAQTWFGIEADIATYGKVVGGGMPIGVVAGKATYMNGIDGGLWNYGDASYPQTEQTFFAGTFNKHPLAMAAARAVLKHLKKQGSALQQQLNQRTSQLAETLNTYFEAEGVPIRIVHFSSLFRFTFSGNLDLLFYHLLEKGVYIWEGRNCFLSTAHTDEDIAYVIQAVKNSVEELREGGFLPELPSKSLKGGKRSEKTSNNLTNSPLSVGSMPISTTLSTQHTNSEITYSKEFLKLVQPVSPPTSGTEAPAARSFTNENASGNEWTYATEGAWSRMGLKPSLAKISPAKGASRSSEPIQLSGLKKDIQFSLYYFGAYEAGFDSDKYKLLFESARFADRNGFAALWVPERHFHSFGGISPNPSVLCAALARETEQIGLRAGSVVLPLHHPIRIAEEWALVDNISRGRVGISFASGWHANDFVFSPEAYGKHRELTFKGIETVKKFWRGESLNLKDGSGKLIDVKLYPMPMQRELPCWLTVVNNPETYRKAGELGTGILTNLMGQTLDKLAGNIQVYRESLAANGHAHRGHVTILVHTYLGNDLEAVIEKARQPFYNYLKSTVGLFKNLTKSLGMQIDFKRLTDDDMNYLLSAAYESYLQTRTLIGTPDNCAPVVEKLKAIGVDEIACFIDFGVDAESVLAGLHHLNALQEKYSKSVTSSVQSEQIGNGIQRTQKPEESVRFETAPMSAAQEQLLLQADISESGGASYNESIQLELRGPLRLEALQTALQKIVDRHETMRTAMDRLASKLKIYEKLSVDIPLLDFTDLAPPERKQRISAFILEKIGEPFDFERPPLLRFYVLRQENQEHILLLVYHLSVFEGWSVGILFQELSRLYNAQCHGEACKLESPWQYRDYLRWLEEYNRGAKSKEDEAYWLAQFSGEIPVLNLSTDRPRPAMLPHRGARHSRKLPEKLSQNLRVLSRIQGATLFMLLYAAYLVLLHRLTDQDDIVVGFVVSGRTFEGSESIMGYCVHHVPIRSTLNNDPIFTEYLAGVKQQLLQAYEHQDYPFARLIEKLNRPGGIAQFPLFMTSFNLERPNCALEMHELQTALMTSPVRYANYAVSLNITQLGDDLLVDIDYSADLFEAATARRWMDYFQSLLEDMVARPMVRLSEISLMSDVQKRQVLEEWNHTALDVPVNRCYQELFESQVTQTPDSIAVIYQNKKLTYDQLNRRANHLSEILIEQGVGPDVIVIILADRGIDFLTAMLAILKAGGAWLPLDPIQPPGRIRQILHQSRSRVVLAASKYLDHLEQSDSAKELENELIVLELDTLLKRKLSKKQTATNPPQRQTSCHLAYVIYTSGSTGRPKGAMLENAGMINHLFAKIHDLRISGNDVIAQTASQNFDISVWQFLAALIVGAAVHVVEDEISRDPARLVRLLKEHSITIFETVPVLLRAMLEKFAHDTAKPRLAALRWLLVTGEALPPDLCKGWLALFPQIPMMNAYGPTECSDDVTHFVIDRRLPLERVNVPIGKPVCNTKLYTLDRNLQPTPVGVLGELCVGGIGVGRGYLGDPVQTAKVFIPDPFSKKPGERLYRTGDLARFLPDGTIEFLGRLDHQVKIRGFRVEIGEIESIILENSHVRETAVVLQEYSAGEKGLTAYVVKNSDPSTELAFSSLPGSSHPWSNQANNSADAHDESDFFIKYLRNYLKEHLPEYMVPSAIVILNALPTNQNGKLDRNSLLVPDRSKGEPAEYVAPRSSAEATLLKIWTEVLAVERIGIHANFFDLGGHSLLATKVISRIRDSFQIDLPLSHFFENPTIVGLAETLGALPDEETTEALPLKKVPSEERLGVAESWDDFAQFRTNYQ